MTDDLQLLREYVAARSDAAFAELVRRHLGLVYHSAMRQLGGDSHLAEDVTQGVFLLLAQKSRSLLRHPNFTAWLHTTAHFKVSEVRRAERRRRAREEAAHLMHDLTQSEPSNADWEHLRPMIDEVLLELKDSDREAVLLRFFEERSFADVAAHLQLTENSAHKRVERALAKLHEHLARRGVKSTAGALAATLTGQAALAASPAGLAASVTGAAITSSASVTATSSLISFMSTKPAATAAVAAMVIVGSIATYQVQAQRWTAANLATIEQENAALTARVQVERTRTLASKATPSARPSNPKPSATSKQTAEATARLGSGGLASREESQAFLRANPEVRAALATYLHDTLAVEYADLLLNLQLTDIEREQLLAINARASIHIVGEHFFSISDIEMSDEEFKNQLRELLGDKRYRQFITFRNEGVLRDVARETTRSLYFTPTPLTAAQAAELQQIVSRAISDPALGPKYTGWVWLYIPHGVWDRVISDASRMLAEPQVQVLRELQQQSHFHNAMTEARKVYDDAQTVSRPAGK